MNIRNWKWHLISIFMCGMVFSIPTACEKNVEDDMGTPDQNDCKDGISFNTDIKPIIDSKCIQCHNGSVQSPDFRNHANIKNNASKVKSLTATRVMPKQGSLTDEQVKLIGCWVDDGAPNN